MGLGALASSASSVFCSLRCDNAPMEPGRLRRPRPLLEGFAHGGLRREVRLLVRAPTIEQWLNLCDLPVTSSLALWQAVRAIDATFPDCSPLQSTDGRETSDWMPDGFTLARAFHWARRQRQVEASERNKQRKPRGS